MIIDDDMEEYQREEDQQEQEHQGREIKMIIVTLHLHTNQI